MLSFRAVRFWDTCLRDRQAANALCPVDLFHLLKARVHLLQARNQNAKNFCYPLLQLMDEMVDVVVF